MKKSQIHREFLARKGYSNMTAKQIARYTALARRYSELVLTSGSSWKPEYTEELQELNRELTAMRKEFLTKKEGE